MMKNLLKTRWWQFASIVLICPVLCSCSGDSAELAPAAKTDPVSPKIDVPPQGGLVAIPLNAGQPSTGQFTELSADETGIEFSNRLLPENMIKYLLNGAGIATGDFDNDGDVDIYAICQDGPNQLLRQNAPWTFEDVTQSAGDLSGGDYKGTGAAFVDVDNDGWLDLYVCNIDGPNWLYMNRGDGTFEEQSSQRGVGFENATTMGSFADYDQDGDLDLYLVNNRIYSILDEKPNVKIRMVGGKKTVHPDYQEQYFFLEDRLQEAGQRDFLLQNDGNGNFKDVTESSGIAGFDMGLSATWWDFDGDGWADIYVANDLKSPDHLYHNQGDGTFVDVIANAVGHTPWFSMGADAADINNDGQLDLLVADMSSTTHYKQKTTMGEMGNSAWFLTIGQPRQFMRNCLFLNSGSERFFEAANLTGLDSTDWSWSIKFADFDSDSHIDVFVTNGVGRNMNDSDTSSEYKRLIASGQTERAKEQLLKMPPLKEENLVFRNLSNLKFENLAEKWGANHFGVSQGASVVDLDRDGDLDLLVNNMNEPLGVYRNDIGDGNDLLVELRGVSSNRFGLDARVTIEFGDTVLTRYLTSARGFMSADEPVLHFGLGDCQQVDALTVTWPGGHQQRFTDIATNQRVTITEGAEGEYSGSTTRVPSPVFAESNLQESIHHHRELEHDDFVHQPLLPNKLSQLGPGLAWSDVNNDGFSDCYVAGAAGQVGALYLGGENDFSRMTGPWAKRLGNEEMGCLFFDFDSDSDQDLYVVSGGFEKPAGHENYRDVIYRNDGQGNFSIATDVLPDLKDSGSCVCAADFDRDGDLDLFVGTRCLPHRWPLAADSRLLVNDNGRFVEADPGIAPDLSSIGLVTSAVWSDVNADGWVDLLVALEWGPVRYLQNNQGKLVDHTEAAGLDNASGWWNSITPGDLDHDGDMDYVAMNTGLNTKYHADSNHPVTLFARDFDGNGRIDLVESEWEGDKCFPIRGKSCSTHAMPMISEKFPTYHEFAMAELSDIYGQDLDSANQFSANFLESVVLINDGSGKFDTVSLPRIAQISPGFGTAINDFDGDGLHDLLILQNFLHPQPETGQMDGGMGLLLKGKGDGSFEPYTPVQSGVSITGQGMAVGVTDLNRDQRPDILATVNDDATVALLAQANSDKLAVRVRLIGAPTNQLAVGARLSAELLSGTGKKTVFEVNAGHGYLSQSDGTIFLTTDQQKLKVDVTWPDGMKQSLIVDAAEGVAVIKKQLQTEP